MPISFIIFIYCFIVKPFETVIVIRGCNKVDLLGAPVGEERKSGAGQFFKGACELRRECWLKILGASFYGHNHPCSPEL